MATATAPAVQQLINEDLAWSRWRQAMQTHRDIVIMLRQDVTDHINQDHPGLEELGSSDLNHYAIAYIRRGELVLLDNPPFWRWNE